jgi:hypothetical protein
LQRLGYHALVLHFRGQHDHTDRIGLRTQIAKGFEPCLIRKVASRQERHAQIEEQNVGLELTCHSHRLAAITGFANDFQPRLCLQ